MGSETFLSFLPAVIGLSFVGFLAIAVAVFQDGKHDANRADIVKRGYIYLVSFVTILLVALAVVSLADLGLRNGVFTKADPTPGFSQEPPPGVYLTPKTADGASAATGLVCTDGCELTEQQRLEITAWTENFQSWKERRDTGVSVARSLVTPISFLIIAGLVFWFHWRFVKRDKQRMEEAHNLTRSTYFSAMSFIWLITAVFSAGFLLNTILKTVIPGADDASNNGRSIPMVANVDGSGTASLVTCGEACGLDAETIALAEEWKTANEDWYGKDAQGSDRNRDNELSTQLAFLIIAGPLFWLHFKTTWREKKQSPPTQTV